MVLLVRVPCPERVRLDHVVPELLQHALDGAVDPVEGSLLQLQVQLGNGEAGGVGLQDLSPEIVGACDCKLAPGPEVGNGSSSLHLVRPEPALVAVEAHNDHLLEVRNLRHAHVGLLLPSAVRAVGGERHDLLPPQLGDVVGYVDGGGGGVAGILVGGVGVVDDAAGESGGGGLEAEGHVSGGREGKEGGEGEREKKREREKERKRGRRRKRRRRSSVGSETDNHVSLSLPPTTLQRNKAKVVLTG